jgi:uncharacterized protein
MFSVVLLTLLQLQIPRPVGYVNDFAGVIRPDVQEQMLALIDVVRAKSGGEIVVVTLPDLGGRPASEVAVQIGREWGVGARGGPGDSARNAGVVLLLKPGKRPGDGKSDLFIASGLGVEGFITDAAAGRIRDAIGQAAVSTGRFDAGLLAGVRLLAEAYAREFHFTLSADSIAPPAPASRQSGGGALALIIIVVIFVIIAAQSRRPPGRRGPPSGRGISPLFWLLLGSTMSGGRRGGFGGFGGGGFGGGGFGGGGFGGFDGGGGFGGGGAGGSF